MAYKLKICFLDGEDNTKNYYDLHSAIMALLNMQQKEDGNICNVTISLNTAQPQDKAESK